MTSSRRIHLFLAAILVATSSATARADERDEIWKTFAERQRAAETASVKWTKRFHMSAAAVRINLVDSPASVRESAVTDINPPPARCALFASGERACRYENVGLSFAGENVGVPYRSIITYDDSGTYWSFGEKVGASRQHSGRIDERDSPPVWDAMHIAPLVFALRPLRSEAFGPNPGQWQVEEKPVVIDGRRCLVLRGAPPSYSTGNLGYRAYLDRERGYLPVRFVSEHQSSGRLITRVEIRYERSDEPVWVPSRWKVTSYFSLGGLSQESQNDEVEVELGPTLPAETFRIDFPAGTIVSDGRPGGGMMTVVDDSQLIPRRQVEAEAAAGGTKWWPWLAAAGAAVLGGALLLWRRGVVVSR